MPANPPRTERRPGLLERLAVYTISAPEWARNLARRQDELNRMLWLAIQNSLPNKHAPTHLGGNDNLVSGLKPTTIELTSVGNAGTPQIGVSAGDHTHAVNLDFEANPIPQGGVEGNPRPPFKTLKQQTDWLNSVSGHQDAYKPILSNTWS